MENEKNGLAECVADVDRSAERRTEEYGKEPNPWPPEREECERQSPDERCTREAENGELPKSSYRRLQAQLKDCEEALNCERKRGEGLADLLRRTNAEFEAARVLLDRFIERERELLSIIESFTRVMALGLAEPTETQKRA